MLLAAGLRHGLRRPHRISQRESERAASHKKPGHAILRRRKSGDSGSRGTRVGFIDDVWNTIASISFKYARIQLLNIASVSNPSV